MMRAGDPQRPFLSLRNATFRLGDRLVFPQTNWMFHSNDQWAVLGTNGSGKSLLADAVRGKLPLVEGELRYDFHAPPGLSAEEAIGYVSFESRKAEIHGEVAQSRWNSLEEEGALRVRDFLSYERVMDVNPFEVTERHQRDQPRFERRLREASRLLGIAPFFERSLLSLSNGERQRVELARVLCHPLRLLILDEPFAGLDSSARAHFHRVLDHMMQTPLRVMLITTREEDLPRQISHILRVDDCRLIEAGTKRQCSRTQLPIGTPHSRLPNIGRRKPARIGAPDDLVNLRDVTVRYGDTTILRNVSWRIRATESWALLGPNGSGKTTLLSLILGDNPQAYQNHVEVFGQPRGEGESIWELRQRIGWVSPELHLHFNDVVTCGDVVASGFHGTIGVFEPLTQPQRAAVRRWLKQFDLLDYERMPLYGMSAGLQRMALLARALVRSPPLVILDEPCQGLDPAHRAMFIQTVDGLICRGSVTVIYVTHRRDEIPPSIKRVLRLKAGRVISSTDGR
jgi:molybdate transport system ATP-binding protein